MPPRVKCAVSTRDAMLAAARRRFLDESYENVGLRDIARDAGVDVALVGRYFGSKENLFHEVLRGTGCEWIDTPLGADELPAFLVGLVLRKEEELENREDVDRLLIILRSASSPKASELVRTAFREDVIEPIARHLSGPDAELRVAVAFSVLTGTTVIRKFMALEPLLRCDKDRLEKRLIGLLKQALFDENPDQLAECRTSA